MDCGEESFLFENATWKTDGSHLGPYDLESPDDSVECEGPGHRDALALCKVQPQIIDSQFAATEELSQSEVRWQHEPPRPIFFLSYKVGRVLKGSRMQVIARIEAHALQLICLLCQRKEIYTLSLVSKEVHLFELKFMILIQL